MIQTIACACGLDPGTESMMLQTGIAAALSAPFWFRSQLTGLARSLVRGRALPATESCARRSATDDDPTHDSNRDPA